MFVFLLLPTGIRGQDTQTAWTALPELDSLTSPAVAEHSDKRVYVAAVAFSGLVAYTATDTPGAWRPWQRLGPMPCTPQPCPDPAFYANPDTAPVLIREANTLYLFARGKDDNLHVIRKQGDSSWELDWRRITTDSRVRGRVSVVFRRPPDTNALEIHVLYVSGQNEIEYREFASDWRQIGETRQWCNAMEGTLGTDGATYLCAAIRMENELVFQVRSGVWPFELSARRVAQGAQGRILDISSVVYFANAFHVAYTQRSGPFGPQPAQDVVRHARIRPGQIDDGYERAISLSAPVRTSHSLTELALYRNKLFAAYTDSSGEVRYARWDTADPTTPWIGNVLLDSRAQTDHRPALATYNPLPLPTNPDYAQPNFGNDLVAAITERTSAQPSFLNLSRTAAVRYFDPQIAIYNYGADGGCPKQTDPGAPQPIADAYCDGRPFFTELGYILWSLPHWLAGHISKDAAVLGCQEGNDSGRFDPPCDAARYPVIIKRGGDIYVCGGAWLNQAGNYLHVWDELGHAISNPLGFHDDNNKPPQAANAALSGIPLNELLDGFNLFGQRTDSKERCLAGTSPSGRCRGFTGHANNYDVNSRQHSFMYVVRYYIAQGDRIRRWIDEDLAAGDSLLQQKYNWVRKNLFRGVEFRTDNEPLAVPNDLCADPIAIRDGIYTGSTEGAGPESRPDVWFSYQAGCTGTLTVNTCGSAFDTVVTVYNGCPETGANELGSNDNCATPGCGPLDSCLSVPVVDRETYWIRVTGAGDARGEFRLSVSSSCPPRPLFGTFPDRFDAGESRNDSWQTAAVLPDVTQESRLIPGARIENLNHDHSDDIDFFTVQLPSESNECCSDISGPGTLQGQFRILLHPEIRSSFEITVYRGDGSIFQTASGFNLSVDCPHDAFPDGRITFSIRDPNCRNTYGVSLWYYRCETLLYKPWYLLFDPPLFNWTIPSLPEDLNLVYPLDPEVMSRHLSGQLDAPYPPEFLRFDRLESGAFNLALFLPHGGGLSVDLLDEEGELIRTASWRETLPVSIPRPATLPVPIPYPFRYLSMDHLPPGTYYLRIEGTEIGIPYVLSELTNKEMFEDDFTGGLDPASWAVIGNSSLYSIDVSQGEVHLSKPPGGEYGLQFVGVELLPRLQGDFDVRVRFRDAMIDRIDGAPGNQVQLNVYFGEQALSLVRSDEAGFGHNAHVFIAPPGEWRGSRPEFANDGTLRVTRVGTHVSAFFDDSLLFQADYSDAEARVTLTLQNNGTRDATEVAFDDFFARADRIIRPEPVSAEQGLIGRYYTGYRVVDQRIVFDKLTLSSTQTNTVFDFWNGSQFDDWNPIGNTSYSVQWTGYLHIREPGRHRFGTISDDGSQIWIDGQLVVDNHELQWFDWEEGHVDLAAGYHPIEIAFYEDQSFSGLQVWWLPPSAGTSAPPPYSGETFHTLPPAFNPDTAWMILGGEVLRTAAPDANPLLTVSLGPGAREVGLAWTGRTNVSYAVQSSTNLVVWRPVAGPLLGTDGVMTQVIDLTQQREFFRLRFEPIDPTLVSPFTTELDVSSRVTKGEGIDDRR